jgi:hypothetical protein
MKKTRGSYLTSLGRGLESVVVAAEGVVARRAGVGGAVGLAAGLDPDEGVDEGGAAGTRQFRL